MRVWLQDPHIYQTPNVLKFCIVKWHSIYM